MRRLGSRVGCGAAMLGGAAAWGASPLPTAAAQQRPYSNKMARETPVHAASTNAIKKAVIDVLRAQKKYTDLNINREVNEYFSLGIEPTYFRGYPAEQIAEHIGAFIAGKKRGLGQSNSVNVEFTLEKDDYAIYVCDETVKSQLNTETKIERYLHTMTRKSETHCTSIRAYVSERPPSECAHKIVIYSVSFSPFVAGSDKAKEAHGHAIDVKKVCSEAFLERPSHVIDRYSEILRMLSGSFGHVHKVYSASNNQPAVSLGFYPDRLSYLTEITQIVAAIPGAVVTKKFVETFANGAQVYTIHTKNVDPNTIAQNAVALGFLPDIEDDINIDLLAAAFRQGKISANELVYTHALLTFAYYFTPQHTSDAFVSLQKEFALQADQMQHKRLMRLRGDLWKEVMSESYIIRFLAANTSLVKILYEDFVMGGSQGSDSNKRYAELLRILKERLESSASFSGANMALQSELLNSFIRFNRCVLKTNFFKSYKNALAFRLDAKRVFANLDYPQAPYGLFMVIGPQFRGFHVRFSDIARGGIRLIKSMDKKTYRNNAQKLFAENYGLAFTQHNKNKDIPEGGSKGTILIDPIYTGKDLPVYMKYIDSLLDVMLLGTEGVRDDLKERELLFLGPDENTAGDYPTIAAQHSRARNYSYWKSFTTGKSPEIGGIPHDTYGMTTCSVREYAKGIMRELNLNEAQMTKLQTGGPDGDLGANEIIMSNDITVGVVDGSGVAFDPKGLDRAELNRLVEKRSRVAAFDKSRLSKEGFIVKIEDQKVTLPHGEVVQNGVTFRDEFHLHPLVKTDFFVPCGGRPEAITIQNVHNLIIGNNGEYNGDDMLAGRVGNLASSDRLKYKYIVEGANLFITEDARIALENVGVHLFKDASTNKGGVTSSSLEVLAGLALTDEEHRRLMCIHQGEVPQFYRLYTDDVVRKVKENAKKEFDCIWREYMRIGLGAKKTHISNVLSQRIVSVRQEIMASDVYNENPALTRKVIKDALPKLLLDQVGLDQIMMRVPDNYLKAIFSTALASQYVYTTGLHDTTGHSLFEYMWALMK